MVWGSHIVMVWGSHIVMVWGSHTDDVYSSTALTMQLYFLDIVVQTPVDVGIALL